MGRGLALSAPAELAARGAVSRLALTIILIATAGCSLEQKAALGVSDAQYQLGMRRLVQEPPDYAGAVESLRDAAVDGHMAAQKQLGRLYASLRPQPDLVRAYLWLHLAAPFDPEAKRDRDALALAMAAEDIALAQELAASYAPGTAPDSAPETGTAADRSPEPTDPAVSEADATARPPEGTFFVQAGAFKAKENAERLAEELRRGGYSVSLMSSSPSVGAVTKVRIGPYERRADAEAAARRIGGGSGAAPLVVEGGR